MRHWLMKCEPTAYSIDDLQRDGTTRWEGVRNFQARNLLRDQIRIGDQVLFYASSADPSGVTGIAEIARAGYPDPTQFRQGHDDYDPKAKPDRPIWYLVDLKFVEKFPRIVPLATLKSTRGLEKMMVIRRGSRLSVQPVSAREFEIVCRLGRSSGAGTPH